jgi:hypothetical protein
MSEKSLGQTGQRRTADVHLHVVVLPPGIVGIKPGNEGWIIDLNDSPEPPKIVDAEANAIDLTADF